MNRDLPPTELHPSRRTVTRAAAWTVPVIAVAATAPAYAASCAPLTGISFSSWQGTIGSSGAKWSQTYTPAAGTAITLTINASYSGAMKAGSETSGGPNLYDVWTQVGNTGRPGLGLIQTVTSALDQTAPGRNARGTYSMSFSKPVSNLTFTLTDIDQMAGDFKDRVELSGSWTEVSRGGGVTGGGTQTTPWVGGASYDDSASGMGNVTVSFAGPVSSFTLVYWNAETSWSGVDRNQAVFLTDMTFDYSPC